MNQAARGLEEHLYRPESPFVIREEPNGEILLQWRDDGRRQEVNVVMTHDQLQQLNGACLDALLLYREPTQVEEV